MGITGIAAGTGCACGGYVGDGVVTGINGSGVGLFGVVLVISVGEVDGAGVLYGMSGAKVTGGVDVGGAVGCGGSDEEDGGIG